MSNRQARREQARSTRPQRGVRPSRPPAGRGPSRPTSTGGSDLLSRRYLLGVAALIIIMAVVLVWLVNRGSGGGDEELVRNLEGAHAAFPSDLAKGTKVGKDSAPVKLTEFEDVQCPFCLRYTANNEPTIVEEYVKSGKVQIEYQHLVVLGKTESLRSALALECAAEQEKFWDLHNKLFTVEAEAGQSSNEKVDVGRFSDDKLRQYASELGVDKAKFEECFNSDKYLDKVTSQGRAARSLGLSGTPSFVINGTPVQSPATIEGWRTLLDDAYAQLSGATSTPTANASPASSPSPAGSPSPAAGGTGSPQAVSPTPAATRTP